ncbi:hypothetical protein ACQPYE_19680 [Actinosynnema sp. CA-299493]
MDDVLHVEAKVFDSGARAGAMSSVRLRRRKPAGLVGEDDTTALLTGAHGAAGELASSARCSAWPGSGPARSPVRRTPGSTSTGDRLRVDGGRGTVTVLD